MKSIASRTLFLIIAIVTLIFVPATTFAQSVISTKPVNLSQIPKGAQIMTQQGLEQQMLNTGQQAATSANSKSTSGNITDGGGSVPSTTSSVISFVQDGAYVSNGLSILVRNNAPLPEGSFVWAVTNNPGQPSLYRWGLFFQGGAGTGGLYYPLRSRTERDVHGNGGARRVLR